MTYEETIELEKNIKLKNKADEIYANFLEHVNLRPKDLQFDGRFKIWSSGDSHKYIKLEDGIFILQCRFLHQTFDIRITPSDIFASLQNNNKEVGYLEATIDIMKKRKEYNV